MGEYARSLAIAQAARARWHDADIHFIVSERAPYASSVPFPATLLPSSATFHSAEVIEELRTRRPDVVIFDNAGRTAQLRAAHAANASVVYISARARQRAKAFRWRWMAVLDEHWIAYPKFIAGGLSFWERCKLRLLKRPAVRFLDVILAKTARETDAELLARLGCASGVYVLIVPGAGTGHPQAADASAQFMAASHSLAAQGVRVMYVGPGAVGADAVPSLPQAELGVLMRHARLLLANGGSTLLQGIACGVPCVAAPIANDQTERIRRCVGAGVAVAAALNAKSMTTIVLHLLSDDAARRELTARSTQLSLADGVEVALDALQRLLLARPRRA